MIDSFSKFWKVNYLNYKSLKNFKTSKPVWVFATVFDLLKCFENNTKLTLPPQSLIIETEEIRA